MQKYADAPGRNKVRQRGREEGENPVCKWTVDGGLERKGGLEYLNDAGFLATSKKDPCQLYRHLRYGCVLSKKGTARLNVDGRNSSGYSPIIYHES